MVKAFIAGALALCIAACATAGRQESNNSPATIVYQAQLAYAIPLTAAVEYNKLPRCTPTPPPICSSQEAVEAMRKANVAARSALDAGEKTVRDPASKADTMALAATAAMNAVESFKTIVSLYKRN